MAAPRLARARDPEAMPLRLTEKSDIYAKIWSADCILDVHAAHNASFRLKNNIG